MRFFSPSLPEDWGQSYPPHNDGPIKEEDFAGVEEGGSTPRTVPCPEASDA